MVSPQVIEIVDLPQDQDPILLDPSFKPKPDPELFKAWCSKGGILGLDRIEYPHMFGGESETSKYPGVMAKQDIKHREAIFAVPHSLLISLDTVKEDKHLYDLMIDDCPSIFSSDECEYYSQLSLVVFLMIEHVRGSDSKWEVFIDSLPQDCEFFCDWHNDIKA